SVTGPLRGTGSVYGDGPPLALIRLNRAGCRPLWQVLLRQIWERLPVPSSIRERKKALPAAFRNPCLGRVETRAAGGKTTVGTRHKQKGPDRRGDRAPSEKSRRPSGRLAFGLGSGLAALLALGLLAARPDRAPAAGTTRRGFPGRLAVH